jgi:predicted ferric reductase
MSISTPTRPVPTEPDVLDTLPPAMSIQNLLVVLLTVVAGVLFALNLVPAWLPGLSFSISGTAPKIFWFLSRGSAIAAFWILWLSMAMGVIITNKMAQIWPGIPPAYEIHQYTSLLGLAVGLFHALILTGDKYINYTAFQVLVPFASQSYRPLWVGIGQLAFYSWLIIVLSFYARKRIGKKAWRLIHFASYASFLGEMLHAVFSGSDSAAWWARSLYWTSGAILLFLTIYRVLIARFPAESRQRRPTGSSSQPHEA